MYTTTCVLQLSHPLQFVHLSSFFLLSSRSPAPPPTPEPVPAELPTILVPGNVRTETIILPTFSEVNGPIRWDVYILEIQ